MDGAVKRLVGRQQGDENKNIRLILKFVEKSDLGKFREREKL